MSETRNAFFMDSRCPRCNSTLISNGVDVWCSFVGGGTEPACDFGLNYDVHVDGLAAAVEHERGKVSVDTPLQLFGYSQVDEAFRLWREMLLQERRQLAERMARHNPGDADSFSMWIFDAVYATGYYDHVLDVPDPGSERHERIEKILKSIMGEDASAQNEPETA
jgi:hypothetical protein